MTTTRSSIADKIAGSKGLAITWIIVGAIGAITSLLLYLEYVGQLNNETPLISCTLSVIVSCTPNLLAPAGNLLGFSNSIIGMSTFPLLIAIGTATLAGGSFKKWFWRLYHLGIIGSFGLVLFFSYFSIFVGGKLCPWCMCIWLVVIPNFWFTTGWMLKQGIWGQRLRRFGRGLSSWAWVVTLVHYALIVILAEVVLHAIQSIFG